MANIKGWFTMNGMHIPIMDGQSKAEAAKNYMNSKHGKQMAKLNSKSKVSSKTTGTKNVQEAKKVKETIKELSSNKYEDGTYDLDTKKSVEFSSGFQATFQQLNDNYSDEEFGALVNKYKSVGDGKAYGGKFGGEPEVSFHFSSEKDAIQICKKFNQVSYWDWKTMSEVKNPYYKKGKGNDYE